MQNAFIIINRTASAYAMSVKSQSRCASCGIICPMSAGICVLKAIMSYMSMQIAQMKINVAAMIFNFNTF